MPFLIDGHNLIPKIGLSLQAPDDEQSLIDVLLQFARRARSLIEVYFDGAPPGQRPVRRFGRVTAHFVRVGTTADSAIASRLATLGREARNWTVVSSDHEVQQAAAQAGARVSSADAFANTLRPRPAKGPAGRKSHKASDEPLSEREVDEWLRLFQDRRRHE